MSGKAEAATTLKRTTMAQTGDKEKELKLSEEQQNILHSLELELDTCT